jgi:hypothetical protein
VTPAPSAPHLPRGSSPCPPRCASSSRPRPTRPTSTVRPGSPSGSPVVWRTGATTCTSSRRRPTGPPARPCATASPCHGVRSHRYFMRPDFQVCMPWETGPATAALMAEIDPDVVHTQRTWCRPLRGAGRRTDGQALGGHQPPDAREPRRARARSACAANGWATASRWKDLGRVFGRADVVTAPTPRAVELLHRHAGLVEAFPVSCGIDAGHYRCGPEAGPGPFGAVRGPDGPGEAGRRADQGVRRAACGPARPFWTWSGTGPERGAWTSARRRARRHRPRPVPRVRAEEELVSAYASAAVFCMPGIAELQSLVTLEAMASGTR